MLAFFMTVLLLWSLCVAEFSEISQPVSEQTLKLGESATIECYIKSSMNKRVWYKLSTGRRLLLVAFFNTKYKRVEISSEFDQRYSVKFDNNSSHLGISRASQEDVGTYFCGVMYLNDIRFGSGTSWILKGSERPQQEYNQANTALIVSNAVFGIVIILLSGIICRSRRKDSADHTIGQTLP
ncbi:novel immune-type receptor 6b [Nematolebias whitei]|uniref:novel immune-type receptor 6b n=1 Tax=Nematolebias whitei TaxID=451745 RepID=UPI00189981DF|nr:novel immune-type receptor 6b [Nematolebias whitei]